MQTYGKIAFGVDRRAAGRYLGDAPSLVLKRVAPP
jgi:hypothetical protein